MVVAGEDAFATLESYRTVPSGLIRLKCSYNVGVSFLIAQISLFSKHHPEISFDVVLDDSTANQIEERFDVAILVGELPDTGMSATELCMCRMVVCASADFLSNRPGINEPADLATLPWVTVSQLGHPGKLSLLNRHNGQQITLSQRGQVKTRSDIAAREFIRSGAGIGLLPDYAVADDIRSGKLVELLPEWREPNDRPISAVFSSHDRRLPARVSTLVDFLRETLPRESPAALLDRL
jgi:DNA-binding transcriptional LysR family regulator